MRCKENMKGNAKIMINKENVIKKGRKEWKEKKERDRRDREAGAIMTCRLREGTRSMEV